MDFRLPQQLIDEQRSVEAQIREMFRGVTRSGGVSWSESVVNDDRGGTDEQVAARAQDTERTWEDLVDDPAWNEEMGIGGFNFVDAIGFTYYIAPAMIRYTRDGLGGDSVRFALVIDRDFKRNQIRLLSTEQKRAVARFVRFMIAAHEVADDYSFFKSWQRVYELYWRRFDVGAG